MDKNEFLKTISRQVTDNVPKLYIQDVVSGRVFEYGKNCHDKLLISEDGRYLYYENMQNSDGSKVGDYRFYYEKPKNKIDFDADEWARMVEHQSISELLAEERKKLVQEVKQKLCRVEDTLINLGNGKEDALNYFVKILDQIERGKR